MKLTAVVITKNEERVIERCLRSLAFCDETLVIDSGSTDRTQALAAALGAKVHVHADWLGFAVQRNRGLAQAQGEWTLMIDADEWVTEPLQREILAAVRADAHVDVHADVNAAYQIPRLSSYCGQFMRHSGWWPDHVTRLLRTRAARFEGEIHERAIVDGSLGKLTAPLMHESFRDLNQVLTKMNAYSTWGAQTMVRQGKRGSLTAALAHGFWSFFRTYVLRAGFLDGRLGLMLAISNAEGSYYKHVKAMLLSTPPRPLP
jgi:glycosyltransferase involved in cell wall biosynthesis